MEILATLLAVVGTVSLLLGAINKLLYEFYGFLDKLMRIHNLLRKRKKDGTHRPK